MSVFESLLNHDFVVTRRRRSPDGQGGWAIDYVDVDTVAGRMRPAGSREQDIADLESREITHVFYCVAGADIVRGDRITLDDLTVEVEAIREPSLAGEHLEIDCREVQAEQSTEDGS